MDPGELCWILLHGLADCGRGSQQALPKRVAPAPAPGDARDHTENLVSKRTFQPNTRRRAKTHGFRLRMRTRAGRAIIANRRRKGRTELSA